MRTLLVLCILAGALAQQAAQQPATTTPVHMVEPVYDNSRPAAGQADAFPCNSCGGELRPPVGTNVVIDEDVTAPPAWNSTPSSQKFVTFDSSSSPLSTFTSKSGRQLSGIELVWKFGNATLRLANDVRALRQSIRQIALRVDAHKAHLTTLTYNASNATAALTRAVDKLVNRVRGAVSAGRIKAAAASRFEEAAGKIRRRLERCSKAIAFLLSVPKDKTPLPANAPAVVAYQQTKAAKASKQGSLSPLAPAAANVAAAVKKAVLKVETVAIARKVDELQNLTISTARNVDKNKTGVTRLVEVIRNDSLALSRQLLAESRRVNDTLARGLITVARQQKEMRAIGLLRAKLSQIRRALSVIVSDNQKLKQKNKKRAVNAPKVGRFQKKIIKLAAAVDKARKKLQALKKQPRNAKFIERVGRVEGEIIREAKKIDEFIAKVKRLAAQKVIGNKRAARVIRAITVLRGHVKQIALQLAALKARK